MNLEELRKEVANVVDDRSFNSEDLDFYINEALQFVAGQIKLPSLKSVGTVSLLESAYSISLTELTDELIGGLTFAVLSNGQELNIHGNLEALLGKYPELNSVGTPRDVALEHQTLWYHPMGDFEATLIYYTRPPLLRRNEDTVSCLPSHLHRQLLVHGAAWMIFDMIEDGVEGKKVNTLSQFYHSFNEDNKNSGIVKLREWLGLNRVHHISSIWRH